MLTEQLSLLATEVGNLTAAIRPKAPAIARLEQEIAYMTFVLKMNRMTSTEKAIYFNGLAVQARTGLKFHG